MHSQEPAADWPLWAIVRQRLTGGHVFSACTSAKQVGLFLVETVVVWKVSIPSEGWCDHHQGLQQFWPLKCLVSGLRFWGFSAEWERERESITHTLSVKDECTCKYERCCSNMKAFTRTQGTQAQCWSWLPIRGNISQWDLRDIQEAVHWCLLLRPPN